MKHRAGTLAVTLVVLFALANAPTHAQTIMIAGDVSGTDCDAADYSLGLFQLYVLASYTDGSRGARFSIPDPPCLGAMLVGEAFNYPGTTGSAQTGLEVDFGNCVTGTTLILTMSFFGQGTTPPCCYYRALGHPNADIPNAELRDCGGDYVCTRTTTLTFNDDGSCRDCWRTFPPEISNPGPADGATEVELSPTLTWDTLNPEGGCSHDVFFGTSPTPPLVGGIVGFSYAPRKLEPNVTYYWRVAPYWDHRSINGPLWSFTTANSVATEEVTWGHIKSLFDDRIGRPANQ